MNVNNYAGNRLKRFAKNNTARKWEGIVNNILNKSCVQPNPSKKDLIPLGCNLIPDNKDLYEHKFLTANLPTPGNKYMGVSNSKNILVGPPKSFTNSITPKFNKYSEDLYKTEYDKAMNLESNGVLINTNTGKMFETFKNALPPPTTFKQIPQYQLQEVNPMLLKNQGGLDNYRYQRRKKEICKDMPDINAGANVWGPQLYTKEMRKRIRSIVSRDIFNNKNGDYATKMSLNGERPAGYTGYVPNYRSIPKLLPTNQLHLNNWKPNPHYDQSNNKLIPKVSTRKVDLEPINPKVTGISGTTAGPIYGKQHRSNTMRGDKETDSNKFIDDYFDSSYVVVDTDLKPTQKDLMENKFPISNVQSQSNNLSHVVIDTDLKSTQKDLMEQKFPTSNAQIQSGDSHYVLIDTDLKPTQKDLMETNYSTSNAQTQFDDSSYVIIDTNLKQTQKDLMETPHAASNANLDESGNTLDFQGELNTTKRMYYNNIDKTQYSHMYTDEFGESLGPGQVFSKQCRGLQETNYKVPNKIPVDVGDTNNQWIPKYSRPTKRESGPNVPSADFNQSNLNIPRVMPEVRFPCIQLNEIDDDALTLKPDDLLEF
jgi:hypothetical protein